MPCFFKKIGIKKFLESLNIKNIDKLYKKLLEEYSDFELHSMREKRLIHIIRRIYAKNKKELEEETVMMYI